MKHIMIALVVCAIPAMTFGQTAVCEDCTHDVSIYAGDGGLIAEADGVDIVTWVSQCGRVIRTGELEANDEGIVTMLFKDADLVCNADESRFQIGPVRAGGWYWLTGDRSSAVGALVNQAVLGNDTTDTTDPGPGVTMKDGRGAVLLEEISTGRRGILPNILPKAPGPSFGPCGYGGFGRLLKKCTMGNGGAILQATSTDYLTERLVLITDGSTVIRPAGTATVDLVVDLWMAWGGHITNDELVNPAGFGHAAFVGSAARAEHRLTGVTYTVKVGSPPGATLTDASSTAVAGVTYAEDSAAAFVSIAADTEYCGTTANFSLPVTITATIDDAGAATVTPPVKRNAAGVAAEMSFTVVCLSASAAGQGQELVPDNPFPVD